MKTNRICKICGKQFSIEIRDIKRGKGSCCSRICGTAYAKKARWKQHHETIGTWFWDCVDKSKGDDSCWPWTRSCMKEGSYGRLILHGKQVVAHRVAYELAIGNIPNGMLVCHKCDNPPCCNPGHLFVGTNQDNMTDRQEKGRYTSGGQHHASKLSEQDVIQIRARLSSNETPWHIAQDYPVHPTAIYRIRDGKTWSSLRARKAMKEKD